MTKNHPTSTQTKKTIQRSADCSCLMATLGLLSSALVILIAAMVMRDWGVPFSTWLVFSLLGIAYIALSFVGCYFRAKLEPIWQGDFVVTDGKEEEAKKG